jgi:hypothetical protein
MKIRITLAYLILFSILATGCKKNYVISGKQHILFQYDYTNYAWGYFHEGFYIDDDGNILKYNNPDNWNFHARDYILTESQLAENIAKCSKSDFKISKEELAKFSSYIHNIASSKVTALKNESADAGTTAFVCYSYTEDKNLYKGYLIKMEGDVTCENLNFFSKKVSLWLKDINNKLSKK